MTSENVKTKIKPGPKKTIVTAPAPGKTSDAKPVAAKTSTPTAAVPALKKQANAAKTGKTQSAQNAAATPATAGKTKTKPAKVIVATTPEPAHKPKKSKLVRDSFTIPDHEYKLIQTLKARAIQHGFPLKKSELIRAGILKLVALTDADFKKTISAVDIIKTGRPTKAK